MIYYGWIGCWDLDESDDFIKGGFKYLCIEELL